MFPYLIIGPLRLPTFSFILLFAFFFSILAIILLRQYSLIIINKILRILPIALVFGVVSGRILYTFASVMSCGISVYKALLFGGNVYYGILFGAMLFAYVYTRKEGLVFIALSDIVVTVLPLGQAIGRIGCYCNGCCYGAPYSGILAVNYIVNHASIYVFPTWFIESGFCLLLWLVLYIIQIRIEGIKTGIYCISYGMFRFIIEFYRGDEIRGLFRGISTSQYISAFLVICGIVVLWFSRKNKRLNPYISWR